MRRPVWAAMMIVAAFCLVAFYASAAVRPVGAEQPSFWTPDGSSDLLVRLRTAQVEDSLAAADSSGSLTVLIPELNIYRWQSPMLQSESLALLSDTTSVLYAEPNYPIHADFTPNDPDFASRQWALSTINAPQAWDVVTGSAGIVIAIVDTGIDFGHPDLAGQLTAGVSFVPGAYSAQDDHGHGTHVAGITAASTNNGIGMAGLAWNVRLMPIKVLDYRGEGTYAGPDQWHLLRRVSRSTHRQFEPERQ